MKYAVNFLQACVSLDSFCAFKMGLLPSLTDQVGMFLHSDPSPVSERYLAKRCAELKALFDKMGYSERVKLYTEQPELYKKLNE